MDLKSIKWTAFVCPPPNGHFEWLAMPFGLKKCPKPHSKYAVVYIDDILVFSKKRHEHENHVKKLLQVFRENGIMISKKKIEIAKRNISFLGGEIGNGTIRLQPHIAQKILEFPDKLETVKQIQQFCGLADYARPYFKKLASYLKHIYQKTGKNGQKKFDDQDVKAIQSI